MYKKKITLEVKGVIPEVWSDDAIIKEINKSLGPPFGNLRGVKIVSQTKWKEVSETDEDEEFRY